MGFCNEDGLLEVNVNIDGLEEVNVNGEVLLEGKRIHARAL